ncbi:PLP-dependent transferase [Xylariomycetidae sp. FL2044]|nr:PLP-dependent transferase [Xylariomycetidae sp. FL2044]
MNVMPKRSPLDGTLESLLTKRKSQNKLRQLKTPPPNAVDFSSNSYLSLSTNSHIQRAFLDRLQSEAARTGSPSILGSGGSRLLDGNSVLAEDLEKQIAAFHGAEAGLLFNSAFDANVGLLGCVPRAGDVVLYDELIHASVHDGMRMSRSTRKIAFSHSSVVADMWKENAVDESHGASATETEGLEHVLRQIASGEGGREVRSGMSNVFICVEGIYSMDGDIVDLLRVCEAVDKFLPLGNGYIIVDEAHSVGVLGEDGRGLVCELGLEDRIWARVLGFGKAMSCTGGMVLCSSTTRRYLINYARTLIYTTSMAFPTLASIQVVYEYVMNGEAEARRQYLHELTRLCYKCIRELHQRQEPNNRILGIQQHPPASPIIPLLTAYPRSLASHCQARGFVVWPIVSPTVALGKERVRICLHAGNTTSEVEKLCDAIETWVSNHSGSGYEPRIGGSSDAAGGKSKL